MRGTTSHPEVQSQGILALHSSNPDAENRIDRRAIGQTAPTRLALKSKRSTKFSSNPINVSVFDGLVPIALNKTKPNETNEDVRNFKTNLAIEFPTNPAMEESMESVKPRSRHPVRVDESLDSI